MKKSFHEVTPDARLVPTESTDVIAQWKAGGGPFWIDVENCSPEESARLVAEVGLDEELIRRIQEPGHAARVLPFVNGVFFEFPLLFAGRPPELKSISFVCLDRLLITLHSEALESRWTQDPLLCRISLGDRSTSALVSAALTYWSMDLRSRTSQLRTAILALSEKFDDESADVSIDEIIEVRRRIADLDAIAEEREASLESLESFKWTFFEGSQDVDRLRVALGNTTATVRRIDRLGQRAVELQSRYDANQQEKMNSRLSRLTIISAIFLPLTLMAGIYGMNFEVMPELHHPLGYPLLMGAMILTALGMVWWFRSRGWMN